MKTLYRRSTLAVMLIMSPKVNNDYDDDESKNIFFMGTYQTYLYLVHRLDLNSYCDVDILIIFYEKCGFDFDTYFS